MPLLLRLYLEFAKTGLFSVGGGLATLPFLYEMSRNTGWFSTQDIADMVAVSESTPGPMGINMATYVGFKLAGPIGSAIATLGLISPAIIVIFIISKLLQRFRDSKAVEGIFAGLRPASLGLIVVAGMGVAEICLLNKAAFATSGKIVDLFNIPLCVLAVLTFAAYRKFKIHPVLYIAMAAAAGVIFKL
ncbi:MAG: chromate transporter [Lachnospiraceae bacterium]|nr:chromate transporter [Lachnospiraceae bacterium]